MSKVSMGGVTLPGSRPQGTSEGQGQHVQAADALNPLPRRRKVCLSNFTMNFVQRRFVLLMQQDEQPRSRERLRSLEFTQLLPETWRGRGRQTILRRGLTMANVGRRERRKIGLGASKIEQQSGSF